MPIDDRNRALQVSFRDLRQNTIQESKHLQVRIGTATEQDDRWPLGTLESQQPRIVEVGRDNDACFAARSAEDLTIRDGRKSGVGRVGGFVPETPQTFYRPRRDGHVDEKPHPLSSMTSSSARLAA